MKNLIITLALLALVITTGCSKFPDIGKGYKLDYDGRGDISIMNLKNSLLIQGHVLDYTFDSTFILAVQRPIDSVPGLKTLTYKEYKKAFEKSTFKQYWIIDKTKKSMFDVKTKIYTNVYGPFKKEAYLRKKEELDIPKNLKLKDE